MRLSCNCVNVYTIAYCVQYIPNGHPREDPRDENRACRTSRRGSSCVFSAPGEPSYSCGLQAEQGSRQTRRHPHDDPRAEVGEDVRVGVGAVECQLYGLVTDILARMSRGCYEENGSVEFKLNAVGLTSIDDSFPIVK